MPKAIPEEEKLLGFEQYCVEGTDKALADHFSMTYGDLKEIERLIDIKYPKGKNEIMKLVKSFGQLSFIGGVKYQKSMDSDFLIEANEARFKAENKAKNGIYINADIIRLCMDHGITQKQMADALGTNKTRIYLISKEEGKENGEVD